MDLFSAETMEKVRKGDIKTLIHLDKHGVLMGPGESPAELAKRLEKLKENFDELNGEIAEKGEVDLGGVRFAGTDAIPDKVFAEARKETRDLYGFSIDWVPGFYSNYKMGMLHAGCAFYSYEDFFALFILRMSFKERAKWIIYSRRELMAHELCHIAHVAFRSRNFEELFAYQTATSAFRRCVGGVLRTPLETKIIMLAVLVMAVTQIVNTQIRPVEEWYSAPVPHILGGCLLVMGAIVFRYLLALRTFAKARHHRVELCGDEHAGRCMLFRCVDEEIGEIAHLSSTDALKEWLKQKVKDETRWHITCLRFCSDVIS